METGEKFWISAQRLIQTRSFQGFSFQDIADEVGIRKASLYHHFDSKDAIALAVLQRAARLGCAGMEKLDQCEPTERLEGYFEIYRIIHGKGERMCPGGSFACHYLDVDFFSRASCSIPLRQDASRLARKRRSRGRGTRSVPDP